MVEFAVAINTICPCCKTEIKTVTTQINSQKHSELGNVMLISCGMCHTKLMAPFVQGQIATKCIRRKFADNKKLIRQVNYE